MRFGVEPIAEDSSQTARVARLAEQHGYDFIWIPDSQLIWRETFTHLALCALNTSKLKLGTGVTNLTTRHPTVVASAICTINEISNGRAVLGVARGDSALRLINEEMMDARGFMKDCRMVKELCEAKEAEYHDQKIKITWAKNKVPVYVAAYGPKMLEFAGEFADGAILQIGEPAVVRWMVEHIKKGAQKAGRDFSTLEIIAFTTAYISDDIAKARDIVRWYPSTVSNHVFTLLTKYHPSEIPPELLTDLEEMRGKYDYHEHDVVGAEHSKYVSDRLVDSFTIVGDPRRCAERVRDLEKAGVTNLNLYLPTGSSELVLNTFADKVIPLVR